MQSQNKKTGIVKELLSDIRFGFILGSVLALYDVSFTVMMHYNHLIIQRPFSGVSLFSGGFISYIIVCTSTLFGIGLLWQILRRFPWEPFQSLGRQSFYLTTFIIIPTSLLLLAYLWRRTLPWLSITEGIVMTYVVCVSLVTLCAWIILYKVLKMVIRCLSGGKILSLFSSRFAIHVGLLPPAIFLVMATGISLMNYHSTALEKNGIPGKHPKLVSDDVAFDGRQKTSRLPNILFISIEAFRADHMNRIGYKKRITTPFLDRLSEKGILFTNTFTQSPWTKPSMASIFSSQYLENHHADVGEGLSQGTQTLPGILRDLGYQTVSIYSNPNLVDDTYGFAVIYAYDQLIEDPDYKSPILPFYQLVARVVFPLRLDRFLPKFPWDYKHWWIDAERMNQIAQEWLDKSMDERPFFLHIHYNEPHGPYFEHPPKTIIFDLPIGWNRETLLRRYDSEIEFVDRAIGELLSILSDYADSTKALIVITGDHGQEFMDHNSYGHGKTLFDEVLRVPLILVYPDKLPEGKVITSDIRSVDIAPTVLDLLDLATPASFKGISLLSLIDGTETGNRVVYSQLDLGLTHHSMVRKDGYKLIRVEALNGLVQREFLYDLENDPKESYNIINEKDEVAESLSAKLMAWKRYVVEDHKREAIQKELSPEEKSALKSLGYLQ